MKYRINRDKELTAALIKKYLDADAPENARKKKLYDYYKGKHKICFRTYEDSTKPNNRVVNPYARYITTLMTGYFVGEPVQYSLDDETANDRLTELLKYNDDPSVNKELAKNQSIFGAAYELMYRDYEGNIRYKALPSIGMILIYDDNLDDELLYAIRYWDTRDIENGQEERHVEVYSSTDITMYKSSVVNELTVIDNRVNEFGMVPITPYLNNEEEQGDFELVISEIDAYDAFQSDSVNEADYFADSYLMLAGMLGTTKEDTDLMKENRIMVLPEGGSASWLTKSINDTWIENEKKRLDEDIHKFSFCPAMTDEQFSSNASGVAMRYKLLGLETAVGTKESEFEKGLRRRFELLQINEHFFPDGCDFTDVKITFTRNIPQDLDSMVDTVGKLDGVVSDATRLALLPLDLDIQSELDAVEEKKLVNYSLFTENLTGTENAEEEE